MKKREFLNLAVGKIVASIAVDSFEASDNCALVSVEIRFTDKSMLAFQVIPRPSVEGVWFADTQKDEDKPPQAVLVKP